MANKSAKSLFEQAWTERFEEELGISPAPSMDAPSGFSLDAGAKEQLRAMQKLADFFMASPGFTGRIVEQEEKGLALVIARGDVSLAIPFVCKATDPEYDSALNDRFFHNTNEMPAGYTIFYRDTHPHSFAAVFAEAVSEEKKNRHDMTREADMDYVKEQLAATLVDKVAASLRTRAAMDFIETIKPRL